jgi:hypothetical protein
VSTVLVLGAGATKACGGPMTADILPEALALPVKRRQDLTDLVEKFLSENFHLPPAATRKSTDFPSLPALMSLIDLALDRKQPFGSNWDADRLAIVRAAIEYSIYELIDDRLKKNPTNIHYDLFNRFDGEPPTVITTNYDIIADNAMMAVARGKAEAAGTSPDPGSAFRFPDYGCDISTPKYRDRAKWGTLLKLHGSLNWLYCPNCHAMEVGIADSERWMANEQWNIKSVDAQYLTDRICCEDCGTRFSPVLIAPTHRKDYRNPHVGQIWFKAERALRAATNVVFIGYSLPDDDVEVMYLLKRGLSRPNGGKVQVTVVEHDLQRRKAIDHDVGRRYRALFGDVGWHADGLHGWLGRMPPAFSAAVGPVSAVGPV